MPPLVTRLVYCPFALWIGNGGCSLLLLGVSDYHKDSRPWIGCCYQLKRLIRNMITVQTLVLIWYPWDKLACIKCISNVQPFQCHDNLSRCLSFFLNFISLLQSLYSRLVNIFTIQQHQILSKPEKAMHQRNLCELLFLWTFSRNRWRLISLLHANKTVLSSTEVGCH